MGPPPKNPQVILVTVERLKKEDSWDIIPFELRGARSTRRVSLSGSREEVVLSALPLSRPVVLVSATHALFSPAERGPKWGGGAVERTSFPYGGVLRWWRRWWWYDARWWVETPDW